MISDRFKRTLTTIAKQLEKTDISWAVVGTTNMGLQGIEVNPRDLDITVRADNLKKISSVFSNAIVSKTTQLSSITNEPAWEIKLNLEDIEVQVMGEEDTGQYVSKLVNERVTYIPIGNIPIPCLTLDAEAEAYAETDRPEKAEIIKKFLKSG